MEKTIHFEQVTRVIRLRVMQLLLKHKTIYKITENIKNSQLQFQKYWKQK